MNPSLRSIPAVFAAIWDPAAISGAAAVRGCAGVDAHAMAPRMVARTETLVIGRIQQEVVGERKSHQSAERARRSSFSSHLTPHPKSSCGWSFCDLLLVLVR